MGPDQKVTLVIIAPVGDPWTHDFAKTNQISNVITTALGHFELAGTEYGLMQGEVLLEPNRPLVSYHFVDGTELELVPATAGGV
jgi:hypothetical protein